MAKSTNPFRYFNSSPEVIRLVVMMYVRYPLSIRNVEDLLFERGIDICHDPKGGEARRCGFGGIASAQCSLLRFAGSASSECAISHTGAGTSTRCS
jgi:hypothetical protein